MTLHAPQIILLCLVAVGLGVNIAKQADFATTVLGPCILLPLLWWGGFFG